jgi:hypothetical protein
VESCAQVERQLPLRRMMDPQNMVEWGQLQDLLQGVQLSSEPDLITWGLSKSRQYTIASLYNFLTAGG